MDDIVNDVGVQLSVSEYHVSIEQIKCLLMGDKILA